MMRPKKYLKALGSACARTHKGLTGLALAVYFLEPGSQGHSMQRHYAEPGWFYRLTRGVCNTTCVWCKRTHCGHSHPFAPTRKRHGPAVIARATCPGSGFALRSDGHMQHRQAFPGVRVNPQANDGSPCSMLASASEGRQAADAAPVSKGTTVPLSQTKEMFPHRLWTSNVGNFPLRTPTSAYTRKHQLANVLSVHGSLPPPPLRKTECGRTVGDESCGEQVRSEPTVDTAT